MGFASLKHDRVWGRLSSLPLAIGAPRPFAKPNGGTARQLLIRSPTAAANYPQRTTPKPSRLRIL